MVNSGNAALGGLLSGLGSTGGAGNLGGVFGVKASPYLGAVLRGITSGANFQQPNPTPPASSGTFLPQSSQMKYPFTQPTWTPPRQAPPGMAPESWQKGWNIQYAQPDQMQYLPQPVAAAPSAPAAQPAAGYTGTAANGMPLSQQDFINLLFSGGLPQA